MAKKHKAKTRGKKRAQKRASASKKVRRSGARAKARTAASRRKAARAKTSKPTTRRKKRPSTRRKTGSARAGRSTRGKTRSRKVTGSKARSATGSTARSASGSKSPSAKRTRGRVGGTGLEAALAQTPETGRTVKGRTNPMRTRRSTGTPAGAGSSRQVPGLDRERKQLRDVEETVQGPPSSLDMDRNASAARSGRRHMQEALDDHHETSPAMTGGDVDADWEDAYAVGDEAPGGDNPTPDQDRVDDIGKALGVTYDDNEELKGSDKIAERDKHRWELDPASSDDYRDRE